MLPTCLALFLSLLTFVSRTNAQFPYNPTRLIISSDKSKVYQFSSQGSFSSFDLSKQITASSAPVSFGQSIPFQLTDKATLPIADDEGISVLVGNCQDTEQADVWRFTTNAYGNDGSWKRTRLASSDTALTANYLSAGFSFSTNGSAADTSMYVFGGMCPDGQSDSAPWTSQADYSNAMLSVSSGSKATSQVSFTGTRSPPIPEAGLTITPLSLVSMKSTGGAVSQQQNFVLIGGHTQQAFINMSQVALFSLPEASWAFVGVNQPISTSGELVRRDSSFVEPRSGHTAVLTEDGTKIVVYGGWVGNVTNPATPQLAVLQVGQGYGGSGSWQWTIPKGIAASAASNQGRYGHGAVVLPGNIMMISGGTTLGSTNQKRSDQGQMFYDVEAGTWSSTYKASTSSTQNGLDTSQKTGLGVGLGLGLIALVIILVVWWLYRKRLNARRTERERHLRELAFGSERYQSSSRVASVAGRGGMSEMRSASWNSRQEQQIENTGFQFPWSGYQGQNKQHERTEGAEAAERTGLEVPSPTRGLRKSLAGRGPAAYGNNAAIPVNGPGSVFRIDEVEEESSVRSLQIKTPTDNRLSDPFKDPPNLEPKSAAEERKREVQGWVEDWQSAAVTMNLSRAPSQARTYSSLSQAPSYSESSSYRTGRESPEKSDRTGSNLSEKSHASLQRSIGTVSRQMSQRSVSAGYALFTNAAAAMGRIGGANRETAIERAASKRSISLHGGPPRRTASGAQRPTSGESQTLLLDQPALKPNGDLLPIKDYKNYSRTNSIASQRKRPGVLGSMKRILTGTSHVDVQAQVEQYEEKVEDNQSPTRTEPEMSEASNGNSSTAAPAFWRGKRGAKDWDEDEQQHQHHLQNGDTASSKKRRSTLDGAGSTIAATDYDGEEWDVETAVQKRVVQVMFTVPKEKLRVVNADALSLMSRSDVDDEREEDRERKNDLSRMDSVKEDDDNHDASRMVDGNGREGGGDGAHDHDDMVVGGKEKGKRVIL